MVTWHIYGSLKTRLCGKQHPFWKSTRCKWFRSLFVHALCQLTLLNYAWIFFKHSNVSSCHCPKISLSLRKSLLWEIVTITLSIWHVQWWGTRGKGMLKQEHTRNTLRSQETKHTRNTGKTPEHRLLQENQNFHFKPEQGKRLTWCGTHETVLEQEMGTDSRPWVSCSLTCAASLCKHLGL